MKRFLVLLLAFSVLVSACAPQAPISWTTEDISEDEVTDEPEVEEEDVEREITQVTFQTPELLNTSDILEGREDYYADKVPDYFGTQEAYTDSSQLVEAYVENLETYVSFWETGEFVDGNHAGKSLILMEKRPDGMGSPSYFRFAVNMEEDDWTLLTPYSDEVSTADLVVPSSKDEATQIDALEAPTSLGAYLEGELVLLDSLSGLEGQTRNAWTKTELITNDHYVAYYEQENINCIYAAYPDGVTARYSLVPTAFESTAAAELEFTSVSGESTTRTYVLTAGGCGFSFSCITKLSPTDGEEAKLVNAGSLAGEDVWMLSDVSNENPSPTEEVLLSAVRNAFTSYSYTQSLDESEEAMSIEEFAHDGNIFFVKLGEANYTLVYSEEFMPAVECGKPVIYLYPEERGIFNVKVDIDEMTVSIPHYGENGWTVWATPKSKIFNPEDGKTYPYLFWEGYSDKQIQLDSGFTLARDEVGAQLPAILKDLGLNQKESADFMEFWLPRLSATNTPYIEFNFVGTELFNQVAPLTITPAPDKLIRIYMVYQGVYAPGLPVPDYVTPERKGFTVVEWGGDLR